MKLDPRAYWALGGAVAGALALHFAMPGLADTDDDDKPAEKAEAPADGALHLDAQARRLAGIRLAPVAAAMQQQGRSGYARGLDLSPLAAIASDITAGQAALNASQAELSRLTALVAADQSASRRDLDTARAQAAADRAKLQLACQRVGLEYGAGLARLGCERIPGLVREAAAGGLALVRVDVPGALLRSGMAVEMRWEQGGIQRLDLLGPAATGDSQLQAAGALAILRGRAAAEVPVGRVLPVQLAEGAPLAGVIVPREAVVRADGRLFVYVPGGKDGFARVALEGAQPLEQGWFVAGAALKPGTQIVVAGAGTLLGLESSPTAPAGDD